MLIIQYNIHDALEFGLLTFTTKYFITNNQFIIINTAPFRN